MLIEKKNNIFFRCDENTIIEKLGLKGSEPQMVFKKLRELKDNF